ncbi:MAG: peptidoglycan-binding protein [Pseudomonadota bacterium]
MAEIYRRREPSMELHDEPYFDHDHDAYDHDGEFEEPYQQDAGHLKTNRLPSIFLNSPAKTGAIVMTIGALVVVGANASLFQPGAHPSPLMETREAVAQQMVDFDAPARSDRLPIRSAAVNAEPDRSVSTASIPTQVPNPVVTSSADAGRFIPPAPVPRPGNLGVSSSNTGTAVAQPVPARPVSVVPLDPIAALLAPGGSVQTRQPAQPQAPQLLPLVATVQQILAELGYAPGTIDGVMGPGTEEAIRRFQLRRALEPNGQISVDLIREIERVTGQQISRS